MYRCRGAASAHETRDHRQLDRRVADEDARPAVHERFAGHHFSPPMMRRLRSGLVPDFLDEAFVRLDAELDHDVDQEI